MKIGSMPRISLQALILIALTTIPVYRTQAQPTIPFIQNGSKISDWQKDLQFLAEELPKQHKNLFHQMSRGEFERAVDELRRKLPSLGDDEVLVEMARIIARVGDGHTRLWLTQPKAHMSIYPVAVASFKEGFYVTRAAPEYAEAIGCRLVKIGDMSTEDAYKAVRELIARDNEMGALYVAPTYLVIPQVLKVLGAIKEITRADYLFERADGYRFNVTLQPVERIDGITWRNLYEVNGRQLPLYRQKPDENYWYAWLGESKSLYVRYNRVAHKKDQSFGSFVKEAFEFSDRQTVDRVIVDLRGNGGGNGTINQPLIEAIKSRPTINTPGKLFVVIDRGTFSAAMMCALDLKLQTHATFVGEPTRGKPNSYSESGSLTLPKSEIVVGYSEKFWELDPSLGDAPWLAPNINVEMTFQDYRDGMDPVLRNILFSKH